MELRPAWIVVLFIFIAQLMMGCSTSGRSEGSFSNLMARTDRGQLPSGWQVDCIADDGSATVECFAGKYGTDSAGARKVPFVVAFRQIVGGGGFLGPAVEPGMHKSRDLAPSVSVDGNPPIADMSSDVLLSQLLVGSIAQGRYQFWPSDPDEMEVDLDGFPEAYELLLTRVESEASLFGRTGESARTISDLDKDRAIANLVEKHGENAQVEARRQAERMLDAGNLKGHAVWQELAKSMTDAGEPAPTTVKVDL